MMASRSSRAGFHPSVCWIRSAPAISIAGSPARRSCRRVSKSTPETRFTASMTCKHGIAAAVAAIERRACPASSQIVEREHVGMREIRDVDIVPQAGSVGRRVIRSEDVEMAAFAESRLRRHLDQVRRPLAGLPAAALRVGACHIEVAQHHIVHRMGGGRVPQHQLGHELRGAIGRDRIERRGFPDRVFLGIAIDRRRRREDEPADLVADGSPDQGVRFHRIVEIIAQGIGDGIRDDDRACEMRDGIDAVLLDDLGNKPLVAAIPLDEMRLGMDQPRKPGAQIVEHDDALAGIDQGENHMTSDIAGTAGHQYGHASPCFRLCAQSGGGDVDHGLRWSRTGTRTRSRSQVTLQFLKFW